MKHTMIPRALVGIAIVLLLVIGSTLLALSIGDRTSADTRRKEFPSEPRTMLSYDGSEGEAIMNAASDVFLFHQWLESLQQPNPTAPSSSSP